MSKELGVIEQLLEQQRQIMRAMHDIALDKRLPKAWYLLSECALLKGPSHGYLIDNPWARPLGGSGWQLIGGRKRWPRAAVKEWLDQSDKDLLALYGSKDDKARAERSAQRAAAFAESAAS